MAGRVEMMMAGTEMMTKLWGVEFLPVVRAGVCVPRGVMMVCVCVCVRACVRVRG